MAARLTVVVSQSAGGGHALADMEETLVAELMMTPGLDATMIGPLEHVDMAGTDRLCLDSFNHSFAVVSWLPAEEVARHWERLGLRGRIYQPGVPHPAEVNRLFHVQLQPDSTIAGVLDQLNRILSDRSVKTVSIELPGLNTPTPANESRQGSSGTQAKEAPIDPEVQVSQTPRSTGTRGPAQAMPDDPGDEDQAEAEWAHLDQLVDDFESLDL